VVQLTVDVGIEQAVECSCLVGTLLALSIGNLVEVAFLRFAYIGKRFVSSETVVAE